MNEKLYGSIQRNYQLALENIDRAAQSVGRDANQVRLLVVTKGHPIETARAVISSGATCLGENYVENALPKIEALVDKNIEWHMVGHVQSRKAKSVNAHFSWVHSVDRLKLARRLNNFAGQNERVLPVLLECNVSQEASKFGWPAWNEEQWPQLADTLRHIIDLPSLEVRGLMTMPPFDPDPEKSRRFFIKLRRLRDYFASQFPRTDWSELSMGMSGDYEVAVQEGATIVRVGTAIVGPRP